MAERARGGQVGLLVDPTGWLERARERHGDEFRASAFGWDLFFTFSPEGVRRLYELPEREASFGLATYELIRRKVPDELFAGRRNTPHSLFGAQQVERYVEELRHAIDVELGVLGDAGAFEAFALGRRLGHRLGLATWCGSEAAAPERLDRLVPLLDRVDGADAFVRPAATLLTRATGKRRESAALAGIEAIVAEVVAGRDRAGERRGDFLDLVIDSWSDVDEPDRSVGIARDVVLIHLGSMSNLPAALAWTLVFVLLDPALLAAVRAGDDALLERCASEAIRLAQRSLTLRSVLAPSVEVAGHELPKCTMLATMLSVTNPTAAPGFDRFDASRWRGRKLAAELPAKELVSTFGHGSHSCPAARFSVTAIRMAVRSLVDAYDLSPAFGPAVPAPRRRQLGGVARAARPCRIGYRTPTGVPAASP